MKDTISKDLKEHITDSMNEGFIEELDSGIKSEHSLT